MIDPSAPEQLTAAMLRLCDPATAARLGALGSDRARELTWPRVAERLVRALQLPGVDLTGYAEFL